MRILVISILIVLAGCNSKSVEISTPDCINTRIETSRVFMREVNNYTAVVKTEDGTSSIIPIRGGLRKVRIVEDVPLTEGMFIKYFEPVVSLKPLHTGDMIVCGLLEVTIHIHSGQDIVTLPYNVYKRSVRRYVKMQNTVVR